MGVLEQVTKLKKQGMGDEQIVSNLSQQGVSPREILDALKQSQIKEAVSNYGQMDEDMQPSVIPGGEGAIPQPESAQQQYYQEPQNPQGYAQQQYAPQEQQQQYYQQGEYEQQPYSEAGGISADMVMEVADQVFAEKIKKVQKKLDDASEIAILLQSRTENLTERLKRIEGIIDKLQVAILEKVGSYGQNLESVKKEMSMMQESFSKVLSHKESKKMAKELKEIKSEEHHKKSSKKK